MGFGWLVVGGGGYSRLLCRTDNRICFVLPRHKKQDILIMGPISTLASTPSEVCFDMISQRSFLIMTAEVEGAFRQGKWFKLVGLGRLQAGRGVFPTFSHTPTFRIMSTRGYDFCICLIIILGHFPRCVCSGEHELDFGLWVSERTARLTRNLPYLSQHHPDKGTAHLGILPDMI